ncbi:putative pentatricopeptide repeat-containing protein At5g40405 [Aristolochia californica]|uniref:putative pentatricopeptide repeat-containing protein At5g40405 n=1 Tax=Aristolochia californica TaxID=171875 RepID=UPI0035D59146
MMSFLRSITNYPSLSLIQSCQSFKEIRQVHTQLLVNGILEEPSLLGKFIASIALSYPDKLDYSNHILSRCQNPTVFALNTMIRAYSKSHSPWHSFHFYSQILHADRLVPDNYTFTFLVRTCAHESTLQNSSAVHATVMKRGFESDPHVQSGLIHMYAELQASDSACRVFEGIDCPDLVTQTTMVGACACSGNIGFAQRLFDKMPHRDLVAWNAMIAGYAQCGKSREALELFSQMQIEGAGINEVTLVSVLSACAHLGALDQGGWAHAYIERSRLKMSVTLGTSLIDMYSKCGVVSKALEVFWKMGDKNVFTWSSMIGGLAMNGVSEKCLEMFSLMKEEGIFPNEITFISVLHGCSVAGLVSEGKMHFDSMTQVYGLKPWHEHYGCMVDLYGRAGLLIEAFNFIQNMPIKPHAGAWGALLHACRIHKNLEVGEFASRRLVELEERNDGAYVLISNIYADSGKWNGVSDIRRLMKSKGVRKEPGCSVIEVDGVVHEFFAGDKTHPRYREIEFMVGEISRRMKIAGYVANTKEVLFDVEDEEKEDALCRHSEKVAIAFGLLALREGLVIRIVKNLRVCGDCHDATKVISKVFDREITVRDRNRFHHFKDGKCSCGDYW